MTNTPLQLKTLSRDAIPRALEKADRYRLLNEPALSESICLDILQIDPENQQALVTLLLALTDQLDHGYQMLQIDPRTLLARLQKDYDREYYTGILAERRAKAILDHHASHSGYVAHDLLTSAMEHYEKAMELASPGNDDAILRWNTCTRLMQSHAVKPREDEPGEALLE